MKSVEARFLEYVAFDTRSDEDSPTCPSTAKQKDLGAYIVGEMLAMGIADAHMDEHGYIYGTVAGEKNAPVIGMIAHMDTSPDAEGANIHPRIVAYNGGDIELSPGIVMKAADYESLARNRGKHLIVTDGTTLLGADDKAGVAEILTAVEELMAEGTPHVTVKIGFTPDEEIGRGADLFDVKKFGADFGYTADGGTLGELEYENFNAAAATVEFQGRSIHPGSAKNKMVNAQLLAMEFQAMLPPIRPENTEGYEGFIHMVGMTGRVEQAKLQYILRDHDMDKLQAQKRAMERVAAYMNEKYGPGTVTLTVRDSYYNMRQKLEPCMYVVDRAMEAMKKAGLQPVTVPIRGGTDGARLSYEGLPCPNLCTGGENYHGRFEYIPVEDMHKCVEIIKNILCV